MAEANIDTITDDIKRMLKLPSNNDVQNAPEEPQQAKKKRNRTPRSKRPKKLSNSSITVEDEIDSDIGNTELLQDLSISIDEKGFRTTEQLKQTNDSSVRSTVSKGSEDQSNGSKGSKHKPKAENGSKNKQTPKDGNAPKNKPKDDKASKKEQNPKEKEVHPNDPKVESAKNKQKMPDIKDSKQKTKVENQSKEKQKVTSSETSADSKSSRRRSKSSPELVPADQNNSGTSNKSRHHSAKEKKKDGKKENTNDKITQIISESEDKFKKSLEKNWIFPLKKKSTKFPRANYYCRICSYHLDLSEDCNRHVNEKRHQRRKEVTELENILRFIPKPTTKQIECLDKVLIDTWEQNAIKQDDIDRRTKIMKSVEQHCRTIAPDLEMKMYGSSISGFGLTSSNINIYVNSPSAKCMPKILVLIYDLLKHSEDKFKGVHCDFYSKVPAVILTDPESNIVCQLTINSCFARDTSRLLSIYSSLDPRVAQLGIVFRTWGKICGLDRQKEGTLPAYSFSLMTVYYLQNTSPPVLPVFYKGFPKFAECNKIKEEWFASITKEAAEWKSENTESVSELWLGILRFYILKFDIVNDVVSIKLENIPRTEKKWNSKKLAVEDPFAPKLNVARTVNNAMITEYLHDTLRKAYYYFGLPRKQDGHSWIPMENLEKMAAAFAFEDYKEKSKEDTVVNVAEQSDSVSADSGEKELNTSSVNSSNSNSASLLQSDTSGTESDSSSSVIQFARSVAVKVIKDALEECKSSVKTESPLAVRLEDYIDLPSVLNKQCYYQFTESVLSDGKGLPVICGFCDTEGHLKESCPDDVLPNLRPLPPMTNQHLQVLTKTLQNVINDFAPSRQEMNDRRRILSDVEIFIQRKLYPDACLQLFGSSCNGFGFSKSDLDICLTFKDKTAEGLDFVEIIKSLANMLEKHDGLRSITAITTAKVPIVKFRHRHSGLEGDISLYNTLAQHNTKLLEAYSSIDDRVSILGYAFKVFAKICEIGDASKGSLSSYAYVLMLLHYLQQCSPPVIPVLQELYHPEEDKPEVLIEGWNVWFYEDLRALPTVWPEYCKNRQSIGELWLGLFKYYAEFPIKDHVINIRQIKPLTRFEKLWNGECLAVEDPFDLNHNLGGGLSKKMNNYILRALINARELYGVPFDTVPHLIEKYITPADYFFDPLLLTEGRPPNDRGCRECGKIGHIAKKCPQHLKNLQRKKEREQKYKEQRQLQQQQQLLQQQQQHLQSKQNHGSHHQHHLQQQQQYSNQQQHPRTSNHQAHYSQSHHVSNYETQPLLPHPHSPHQPPRSSHHQHQHSSHQPPSRSSSSHQQGSIYNDRNGMRNSPGRESRRRNNSYNGSSIEHKSPLLPTPVQRQVSEGGKNGPMPLMSVKIDNSQPLLPNPISQVYDTSGHANVQSAHSNVPIGSHLDMYNTYVHQQYNNIPLHHRIQQGPNGGSNYYKQQANIPSSRHKNMYVSGSRTTQGRP